MRLPLRDGDTGRFLGHLYDGQRSTPEVEETKWIPDFAKFRNATAGVTFQWNGAGSWIPIDLVNEPNGCRHCDIPQRQHCQGWVPVVGLHGFVEPTNEQRRERMEWRAILAAPKKIRRLPS